MQIPISNIDSGIISLREDRGLESHQRFLGRAIFRAEWPFWWEEVSRIVDRASVHSAALRNCTFLYTIGHYLPLSEF